MGWLGPAILYAWIPIILAMYILFPARRAVVVALVTSWLFLPMLGIDVPYAPDYTKVTATSYGILLGALLLDPDNRLLNFRPSWIDLPMVVWCVVPFFSSILNADPTNELGPYDGATAVVSQVIKYGFPYLIGRLYFTDPNSCRDFAMGLVIGGLLYVPLCLFEAKMSPQLHSIVYGFKPVQDWAMAKRMGGWRPSVFMQHGLAVGVWMATSACMAFWLWLTSARKHVWGVPMVFVFIILFLTTGLVRSSGAILLMFVLLASMFIIRYYNTKLPITLILIAVVSVLFLRSTGLWKGEALAQFVIDNVSEDRGGSIMFRFENENKILEHTYEKPVFGWGGWGRAYEIQRPGRIITVTPDSYWIIAFGEHGVVGLVSLFGFLLIPPAVLLSRMRSEQWIDPRYAAVSGLAIVTFIYSLDGIFNAMINPIFIAALGGVATMGVTLRQGRAAARQAPVAQPRPVMDAPAVSPRVAQPEASHGGEA